MKVGDKVYLTKYVLSSRGVVKVSTVRAVFGQGVNEFVSVDGDIYSTHLVGRDVFASIDDAIGAAEDARDKKLASLKKQMDKLKKLTFTEQTI